MFLRPPLLGSTPGKDLPQDSPPIREKTKIKPKKVNHSFGEGVHYWWLGPTSPSFFTTISLSPASSSLHSRINRWSSLIIPSPLPLGRSRPIMTALAQAGDRAPPAGCTPIGSYGPPPHHGGSSLGASGPRPGST